MDFLREKVAGKKKRYTDQGYNLDLTYVTKRIIAMSFPGEGWIEGLYRNPIDKVAKLINDRHGDSYQVYNLCGKLYDTSYFKKQVFDQYHWEDHHSPSLSLLFEICHQIYNYLIADIDNVVVIHCLAGKGRTGTLICCFLLYSGMLDTVNDAMTYYGKKRFQVEGLGVNQPCQIRYIHYFYTLLKGEKLYPAVFSINQIKLVGRPKLNWDEGCRPYIEILNLNTKNKIPQYSQKKEKAEITKFTDGTIHIIKPSGLYPLYGDILIMFRNIGLLKENKMFRLSFNTAFVQEGNDRLSKLNYSVQDIDPSQIKSDTQYPPGFRVEVELELSCKCTTKTSFAEKCETCMGQMYLEQNYWEIIYQILAQYKKPDMIRAKQLLFGNEDDDVSSILLIAKHDNGEIQLDKEEFEILDQRNKSLSFTYSEKLQVNDETKIKQII